MTAKPTDQATAGRGLVLSVEQVERFRRDMSSTSLAITVNALCDLALAGLATREGERDAAREATRWIPVTERYPDPGVSVLMWWTPKTPNKYAEDVVIGQVSISNKGQWWNGQRGEYQNINHITHWLPLPQPPEGAG